MTGKIWQAIEATVTVDAREAIEYGLMEAGALGTETVERNSGTAQIIGYFEHRTAVETVRAKLNTALEIYELAPAALIDLTAREFPEQDWLSEWKKHWQPVEVGRFIIAPSWFDIQVAADRIVLRIDPGMAFGTGTHETTRLCLKAIDKYFAGGSFLDVGTGTGILAIAAATLAPEARIIACDTDAEAIDIARENASLNGVAGHIDFQAGSITEAMPSADFVCANLTAPVIVELLPVLLGATCGRLVLSGILDSQFEMVNRRLMQLTATVNEIMQDGEWIALVI
ncbi:MAG TPA: 50S ribosomal protein L11 methyltransferase [Pyrinomonadaceae bacterium]|nr:50S ribosomal protein L11 methyltransferase [Pyrinomonadaceae bacterium]